MAQSPSTTGIAHFTSLNHSVFLHRPTTTKSSSSSSSSSKNGPDLILLIGWMSATPRHLSKYTAAYEGLYPSTSIVAVTTTAAEIVFSSTSANLERIQPALEVLYGTAPDARILLHFFSNGGLFTATMIAKTYREAMGRPLRVEAMVLDSSPGKATFRRTIRAMGATLPWNGVLRALAKVIFGFLYVLYRLSYVLRGMKDTVEQARRDVNDKGMLAGGARRLYVYSKEDDMVDWRDVEEHGREAEGMGCVVQLERFEGSGHAAHMVLDGKRYWEAVRRLWDGGD